MTTHAEIAVACGESMGRGLKIALVLPRPAGRGRRMRLAGRCSPLGEIACQNAEGHAVCYFDPVDVLAWIMARGYARVTVRAVGGAAR
jgi:hypothetical protein